MLKKLNFNTSSFNQERNLKDHHRDSEKIRSFYETFNFFELTHKWPEIVGPLLARVTSPLKIKGNTLIIVAEHASYSQNISFLSEEIKIKIYQTFPSLKNVIKKLNFQTQEGFFKQDQKNSVEKKETLFHPQDPRFKLLKNQAELFFSDVEDEDLKKTLISLYVQVQ